VTSDSAKTTCAGSVITRVSVKTTRTTSAITCAGSVTRVVGRTGIPVGKTGDCATSATSVVGRTGIPVGKTGDCATSATRVVGRTGIPVGKTGDCATSATARDAEDSGFDADAIGVDLNPFGFEMIVAEWVVEWTVIKVIVIEVNRDGELAGTRVG